MLSGGVQDNESAGGFFTQLKNSLKRKLSRDSADVSENESMSTSRKNSRLEIDEQLLRTMVDQNVGYHCLKILALILGAAKNSAKGDSCLVLEDIQKLGLCLI